MPHSDKLVFPSIQHETTAIKNFTIKGLKTKEGNTFTE